jgi:hypothetical protein
MSNWVRPDVCTVPCDDPTYAGLFTRSLLIDWLFVAVCASVLFLIAWTENEKPTNSLIRPDKKYPPKYGVQAVPVLTLLSHLTLLVTLPELLHTYAWWNSNPSLSCMLQHHSIVVPVRALSFSYYL